MDNMELYNKVRQVPKEAQKPINAGRLKGMTDINPMWRIQLLTEIFGMCGIGWYYNVTEQKTVEANNEVCAFVDIDLYVKVDGEWSKPIHGSGGAKLATQETKGIYVSDECFKMATTDAISVACKQLGFGADVYWQAGRSKYTADVQPVQDKPKTAQHTDTKTQAEVIDEAEAKARVLKYINDNKVDADALAKTYGVAKVTDMPYQKLMHYIKFIQKQGGQI